MNYCAIFRVQVCLINEVEKTNNDARGKLLLKQEVL